MKEQVKLNGVSGIREVAALFMTGAAVSTEAVNSGRNLLNTLRSDASEYGFSDAEIVRAALQPVFQTKRGCGCYTCKTRRQEIVTSRVKRYERVHAKAS